MGEENGKSLENESTVDPTFEEFMNDSDEGRLQETEQEQEEVTVEEEDSQEGEDDEAREESEDDSQEEEEEEAEASEEAETGEDEDDYDDDEDDDEDPRDALIAQMRQELDDLKKTVGAPKKEEEKEEPPPKLPEDLASKLLGEYSLEDVTEDPKLFAEVLGRAITLGRDMTYEHVMKRVPKLVVSQAKAYQDLMDLTRKFYNENKDLRPYKNLVATAANEVHSENPEWGTEKVMSEAATRARKTLKLSNKKKSQRPKGEKKKQKPAFAATPKAKKIKPQLSKLEKDIAETLDL